MGDDISGDVNGELTLREAIIAAETNVSFGDAVAGDADGDVIRFDPSITGQTITLTNGQFSITDDLAIFAGPTDVTIDAQSNSRVFDINSSENVVLRDFSITSGSVEGDGGAVQIAGSGSTNLFGLDISSSVASGTGGGAVATAGSRVRIIDTTFDQNIADGEAGSGGGLLVTAGNTSVTNSTFTANVANRAGGGVEITGGTLLITDSTLGGTDADDGNIAGPEGSASPGNGGALHVTGSTGLTGVTIRNTDVLSNVAASEGGGLWNQVGTRMLVVDSQLSGNIAEGDDADNGGGAIFNNGGTTRVRNSTVNGNFATGASGSGGGFLSVNSLLSIIDTNVFENVANRAGGGIEIIDGRLFVADSSFIANVAGPDGSASPGNGGALHVSGTNGTESTFTRTLVDRNVAALEGGGLWNQAGSSLRVLDSDITANVASGDGADDGGGGVFNNGGTTLIRGSLIESNVADGQAGSGGGIFSVDGEVTVRDSTVASNVANRAGGGVEVIDGRFVLNNVILGGTAAADGNIAGPAGTASPGNGGGLHVSGTADTQTIVIGGLVANNVAASEGGGLWNQSGSTLSVLGNATIRDNIALGDAADNGGGGVFNNGGQVFVQDSIIVENSATGVAGSGGGIFSVNGEVIVSGTDISGNVANRAGGGVEIIDGRFLMFDSVLGRAGLGNVAGPGDSAAPGNGGGLHVSGTNGTFVAIDQTFVGFNTAANEGGGLWNQAGSTLVVRNGSDIVGNTAGAGGGGGVFSNGGESTVVDSSISRNTTTGNGGGVLAVADSVTEINDSSLFNNSATNGGGFANDGQASVRDSFFASNSADEDGGAIFDDLLGETIVEDSGFFSNSPNDQS